ncbi:MAG TPA: hypothetical protein ENN87_17205 [Phycisphaerales bacterium]|nr:hypothetical protein [Phycisphaerales bacterium]
MIEIGAVGWDRADPFYPDDLPEDWRLAYYANTSAAVWVPAEAWLVETPPDTAVWREDVSEAFRFVVALDERHADSPGCTAIGQAVAALGEQLEAVVATAPVHAAVLGEAFTAIRVEPAAVWGGEAGQGAVARLARVSADRLGSPRAMREVLEAFVDAADGPRLYLFVDGPLDVLDDLRTLGRLMGVC